MEIISQIVLTSPAHSHLSLSSPCAVEPILRLSDLTWCLFHLPHDVGIVKFSTKLPRQSLEDRLDGGGGVGGWVGLDHVVAPFVLCV
jgi:hypothetical protein